MQKMEEMVEKHELSKDFIQSIDGSVSLALAIDDCLDGFNKTSSMIYNRLVGNSVHKGFNGLIGHVFSGLDSKYFELREKYLEDELLFVRDMIAISDRMINDIDDNNYLEIAKLFDFLTLQYQSNMEAKASKIDGLLYSTKGIEYIDFSKNDTSKDLIVFLHKKLSSYEKRKQLVKSK